MVVLLCLALAYQSVKVLSSWTEQLQLQVAINAFAPLSSYLTLTLGGLQLVYFCSSGTLEFQMSGEGACQQDHTQKTNQAPPTKKSTVYPGDCSESPLSRPPTLHKQPPALPPKPFNRLPNHITGTCCSLCAFTVMNTCSNLCI